MNKSTDLHSKSTAKANLSDLRLEVLDTLKSNLSPPLARERILDYHENDIAAAMELMSRDERRRLYSILKPRELAGVIGYSAQSAEYLDELGIRKTIQVLSCLEAADAVEYLRQIDKARRKTLLELMDDGLRAELMLLSSFDEDEIGSRMSTNFISVNAGSSVKEAMSALIAQAAENDNISRLFVTDDEKRLLGVIDLKELITARADTPLDSITMSSYPYVYTNQLIEDCLAEIWQYSEDSVPVLDNDNRLVGVLLSQDLGQLMGDMLGEDYAKLAGLSSEEDLKEPMAESVKKRLPWLIALLGLGLAVSSVVGLFESVVASLSLIVCFQSLILDMAGNVGTQSLAVTIRVLTDERLSPRQKLLLIGKEGRVGLVNGLILGLLSLIFIGGYIALFKGLSLEYAFSVSLCIAAAMLIAISLSSLTGTLIPIALKRCGIDPAVASGPLITTVNDLVAVVSYYGLAKLFLIDMLGL